MVLSVIAEMLREKEQDEEELLILKNMAQEIWQENIES